MEHEMAELDEKVVRMTKKSVTGLIVILFIFAGSQMAVDSLSSDQRCLSGVEVQQVGKWVGILSLLPSQNAWAVVKQLV